MTGHPLLVLPYLATYRVDFISQLAKCVPNLQVAHPKDPLDATVSSGSSEHSYILPPMKAILAQSVRRQRGLFRMLRELRPTSIVVEADTRVLDYMLLLVACRLRRIPVAVWGLGTYAKRRSFAEWLLNHTIIAGHAALANVIIGKGPGATVYYRRHNWKRSTVFSTSWNSTLLAENLVKETPPICAREPLNLLYVGRLTRAKQLDLALYALANQSDVRLSLHVVGQGPELEPLKHLARELGVSERVHFYGHLTGDALVARFMSAGCFLLPGAGGLAVTEALAAGLPSVLGPSGAVGDGTLEYVVDEGLTAFFAPSPDEAGLRIALRHYVDCVDQGRYESLSDAARESYLTHYSVERMIQPFVDHFNEGGEGLPSGYNCER